MSSATILNDLRSKVAALSEGRIAASAIDPSMPMLECGYIDSLTAVMLLAHIEETWEVEIDETELLQTAPTLQGIADLVEQRRG